MLHADRPPPAAVVTRLVGGAVASRITAGDTAVWPAATRPGWVGATRGSRPLVGAVEALREQLRVAGLDRVVLAATGGVGVAAEALAAGLIVLDTTDVAQVADALAGDLDATVLVVSAPPGETGTSAVGSTVEALWDAVDAAFRADGLDPAAHTVLVCEPDGPLLRRAPATVLLGPGDVDGLWSGLTAYALVPAGLAGADVAGLLADAAEVRTVLAADDPANPALVLGGLLADARTLSLAGEPAMAEWVSELVAGGLGKRGRGPLPVVVDGPRHDPDALTATVGPLDGGPATTASTTGPPAAQVLLWQHAVAVAAHLLDLDPTDRPDAAVGASGPPLPVVDPPAAFVDGAVAVHAGSWLPPGTGTVADALRALVDAAPDDRAHLAVHAYLDRESDASAAVLRPELARRTGLATTFGWAPRCLPGTGQHDKGGPAGALVCQLTGAAEEPVDGYAALDALQRAQAVADAAALAERGRPVLRLHLTDRVAGLVAVARAVQEL